MVQSINLLPFTLDGNFVPIAIPARRDVHGDWEVLDEAAIRDAGFMQTARRFKRINQALEKDGVKDTLQDKINERNKLIRQIFDSSGYFVVNGAGGGISCAACLPVAGNENLVMDQTLYWKVVSPSEAWFRVGLLNSNAITEAVRPFNPQGEFGERHLHTMPNRLVPPFDSANETYREIGRLARALSDQATAISDADPNIANPEKPIAARRCRLRTKLLKLPEFAELEEHCAAVLGTTAFIDLDELLDSPDDSIE